MIGLPTVSDVDDASAQRELNAALERFRGDARSALGLGPADDAAAARRAFMALCKVYHPAKFARYAPPTVKLCNEVFLAIRRAYEQATAGNGVPQRMATSASGPMRAATGPIAASATSPTSTGPVPTRPTPGGSFPAPRPTPGGTFPAARPVPGTPATERGAGRIARPPAPGQTAPPTSERPTTRIVRHGTPPAGVPHPPRSPTTPGTPVPPIPASPSPPPAATPQRVATMPATPQHALFEKALGHVQAKRWAEARAIFGELAAQSPGDPRFRAYLHYARGWEAHGAGRTNEAKAEWQRALACDPAHTLARAALDSTGLGK